MHLDFEVESLGDRARRLIHPLEGTHQQGVEGLPGERLGGTSGLLVAQPGEARIIDGPATGLPIRLCMSDQYDFDQTGIPPRPSFGKMRPLC